MTIATSDVLDDLAQLLNSKSIDNRLDIWMWLCLSKYHTRKPLAPHTCNGSSMRDTIANVLKLYPRVVSKIPRYKDQDLVHDRILNWITDDPRQYQWLLRRVQEITDRDFPRDLVHLQGRPLIIAMLDIWNINIKYKAEEVDKLHSRWRRTIARDSQFAWFTDKKEGMKRCACAWDWIEKQNTNPFSNTLPISNYEELLIFFDEADLPPYLQRSMIQGIKSLWSRRQFDDRNSDKRQINVLLTHATINQLDQLAEINEIKRHQIIEKLIKMEAENNLYLEKPARIPPPNNHYR